MSSKRNICVYANKKELVIATTEKIINFIKYVIQENGLCNIALAGGNTPRDVYSMLAMNAYKKRVDWNCVHLFWGDERTVPPNHPDSNFRMVKQALLMHITIPEDNVHRIRGEIEPGQAATEYTTLLRDHFKGDLPRFDLILLGVGEDGHTASLFPGTSALGEHNKPVVAVFVSKLNTCRVTLTLPVFNAAKEIIFLVSGSSKSDIVQQIINVDRPTKDLPATLINPDNGIIHWMLDSEAAALIDKKEALSKK
ncbi:MAG: 6-phosphogluconolactonase [Candidatus Scalinduaceae bacterium]